MNREQFAEWLHLELHTDIPGSMDAVRFAVAKVMGGRDELDRVPANTTIQRIADGVEDWLGYNGEPLQNWLNEAAMAAWRDQVAAAVRKVLRRAEMSAAG